MSYENLSPEMALVKATAADFIKAMEAYYGALQQFEDTFKRQDALQGCGQKGVIGILQPNGSLRIRQSGSNEWQTISENTPITSGVQILAGEDGGELVYCTDNYDVRAESIISNSVGQVFRVGSLYSLSLGQYPYPPLWGKDGIFYNRETELAEKEAIESLFITSSDRTYYWPYYNAPSDSMPEGIEEETEYFNSHPSLSSQEADDLIKNGFRDISFEWEEWEDIPYIHLSIILMKGIMAFENAFRSRPWTDKVEDHKLLGNKLNQDLNSLGLSTAIAYWQTYCIENNLPTMECEGLIENVRKYHFMFVDPANRWNIRDYTNMSDEALATLVYLRVLRENNWNENQFRPANLFMDGLISQTSGILLDGIKDHLAASDSYWEWLYLVPGVTLMVSPSEVLRSAWASFETERFNSSPRLSGFSLGLPNFYPNQAIDALNWREYLEGGSDYITNGGDENLWATFISEQGSVDMFTNIVVWAAWRRWTNDLSAGSATDPYMISELDDIFNSATVRRRPDEISVFAIAATINTDMATFEDPGNNIGRATNYPAYKEIIKAVAAVEALVSSGRELGYTLEVGSDFIPYTCEEAIWLVDKVDVMHDIEELHLDTNSLVWNIYQNCKARKFG